MKQLIDLTEIAEILHVSPERADELVEGVVFPPSIDDWGGERLWRRADVELWARAIPPSAWPERAQLSIGPRSRLALSRNARP